MDIRKYSERPSMVQVESWGLLLQQAEPQRWISERSLRNIVEGCSGPGIQLQNSKVINDVESGQEIME